MSIFRETQIEWNGTEYTLVPTMALLRHLERRRLDKRGESYRISLVKIQEQAFTGEPIFSYMAIIIAEVMREAGADTFTEEEVYSELYTGNKDAVISLWHLVIAALSPVPKEQKKADAPATK